MKITGQLLKENREAKNLSVHEVSLATKIGARVITAMEEGDLDKLPAKTFLRGFVRSYAGYLKMDVDEVLNTFGEEMGSTLPTEVIESEKAETTLSREMQEESRTKTRKVLAFIGIALLIAVIFLIREIVTKYEAESRVAEAPADIERIETEGIDEVVKEPTEKEASKAFEEGPPPPKPSSETDKSDEGQVNTKKPDSTIQATNQDETKDLTPDEPAPEEPASSAPMEQQVADSEPKQPDKTDAEKPTEKARTKPSKLEVILEALDKVEVSFKIDDGSTQKITLGPDEVHTIKAQNKVSLELSDGGAVNLIQNGRDKGVPGNLGKPLSLKIP